MAASRKDRRAQERRETKVARRALPIVQDTPFRAPIRMRFAMQLADGAQPRDVLAGAQREADAFGARTFAAGPAPACASGCSHCCEHLPVGLSATEAGVLAAHLQQLPEPERTHRRGRIAANAARAREAAPGMYPRMTCALLSEDDRRCSVYEVRPFVCRRAHSFDVERCRRAAAGEAVDILVDARVVAVYSQISTAFREASVGSGGDAGSYELHQAVDILLEDPQGDLSPAREHSDPAKIRATAQALNAALRPRR
jgi:Fe-S-cluster containining protein